MPAYDWTTNKKLLESGDPEQIKRVVKEWAAEEKASDKLYEGRNRSLLVQYLGARCVKCGFTDVRALQIDHIFGGGTKERKKFGSVQSMARYYLNHLDEAKTRLQILCANCNWIKRIEQEEHKIASV